LKQGKTFLLGNWNCVVLRYLPDAVLVNTNFVTYQDTGSVPAALISAANSSGAKVQGWITCGNYLNPQRILQLDSVVSLAMTDPMPRKLSSDVIIYAEHNRIFHATISVNKPCKIDGWYIYQSGYDTNMGKWSRISELELVSDPWLGVVYTGMILLLIGTIFLVVHGRNSTLVKQRRL